MENVIPTTEQILTANAVGDIYNAVIFGERHLLNLLKGKCTKHGFLTDNANKPTYRDHGLYFPLYKHDCPECMKEIEKEVNETP